jgi:hypothetical protein
LGYALHRPTASRSGRWARGHGPLTLPKVRAEYPRRAFALDNARISEFNLADNR